MTHPVQAPPAPPPPCPNCGAPAPARFCPSCGQRTGTRLLSLRAMVAEVLEDQLSLEARLPRTLGVLVARPGQLTADFAAGRVARYLPPFRLYLLAGLLFVLVVSSVARFDVVWRSAEAMFGDLSAESAGSTDFYIVTLPITAEAAPAPLRPLARRYERREAEINAMPPREGSRIVFGGIMAKVSAALFLLLPAFALLMKGLLRRRLYIEHVIFFLHLHAAFFLLALVPLLLQRWWVTAGAAGIATLYLLLALRRAYALGWVGTVARVAVLVPAYLVAAMVAFVGVIFVTVLTY